MKQKIWMLTVLGITTTLASGVMAFEVPKSGTSTTSNPFQITFDKSATSTSTKSSTISNSKAEVDQGTWTAADQAEVDAKSAKQKQQMDTWVAGSNTATVAEGLIKGEKLNSQQTDRAATSIATALGGNSEQSNAAGNAVGAATNLLSGQKVTAKDAVKTASAISGLLGGGDKNGSSGDNKTNLGGLSGALASLSSSSSGSGASSASSTSNASSNVPGIKEYQEYVKDRSPYFDGEKSGGGGSLFEIEIGDVTIGVGANGVSADGYGQSAALGTNGKVTTDLNPGSLASNNGGSSSNPFANYNSSGSRSNNMTAALEKEKDLRNRGMLSD